MESKYLEIRRQELLAELKGIEDQIKEKNLIQLSDVPDDRLKYMKKKCENCQVKSLPMFDKTLCDKCLDNTDYKPQTNRRWLEDMNEINRTFIIVRKYNQFHTQYCQWDYNSNVSIKYRERYGEDVEQSMFDEWLQAEHKEQ